MFGQNFGNQILDGFNTTATNQQNNSLLGAPQFQKPQMAFDPESLNTTALQSTPEVANMIKALKGDSNG